MIGQQEITQEFLEFCSNVWGAVNAADEKHGTWQGDKLVDCFNRVEAELEEVYDAIRKGEIDGQHGIKAEAVQVAACAYKMIRRVS